MVGPQSASDQQRRPAYRRPNPLDVFLNFPYDDQFRTLYLGYIAGICTPRFNMPFELGLAVMAAMEHPAQHTWCVFESSARRVEKSLSDLGGTDAYVHDGTIDGLFRELCNALVGVKRQPAVHQMMDVYAT